MTSGRKILADKLKTDLPDWLILATARQLDAITKRTCILWTARRKRDEQVELSMLIDEIELWVFDPSEHVDYVEDALDDALLEVIEALEQHKDFAWQEAERGTLMDKFSGWRIPVICIYKVTAD